MRRNIIYFLNIFYRRSRSQKNTCIGRNHMGTLVRMVLYDDLDLLVTRIRVSVEQGCGSCHACTLLIYLTFSEKQDSSKTRWHFSMDIHETVAGATFFPVLFPSVTPTNS